jgi:propanol-preferring alcohol dehydrogenase
MVLERPGEPLRMRDLPIPAPQTGQVLVKVAACGVCRTDLHVTDGDLVEAKLPIVPGHEIVGQVEGTGDQVRRLHRGDRVGIPWLGHTCGVCCFCTAGEENLCDSPRFTGYQIDGGYAEYCLAEEAFCFHLPDHYADAAAAPLLCAGLIGYRSLRMAGEARQLGIYGFGAAAHILAQVAQWQGRSVYAFTRPGDVQAQTFARSLGCIWAGGSDEPPPQMLDAAIIFAPVGTLVPAALSGVRKGGRVVLGGIHMSDIPAMPYRLLWGERSVHSVANLTRRDAVDFLALAARTPIRTHIESCPLSQANAALQRLREGRLTGAAVLIPDALGGASG